MKRLIGILSTLGLLASAAHATVVKRLSLEELARRADVVTIGTVEKQTSAWNERRDRIYTVTEVRVTEALKGAETTGALLRVRQLGGTVDGLSQTISGNAELRVGEEVVLFLDRDDKLEWHYVLGMAQGKYAVDRRGAAPVVVRNTGDLALADVGPGGQVTALAPAPASASGGTPLDAFRAAVREAAGAR